MTEDSIEKVTEDSKEVLKEEPKKKGRPPKAEKKTYGELMDEYRAKNMYTDKQVKIRIKHDLGIEEPLKKNGPHKGETDLDKEFKI